ncbi:hypothetical protein SSS_04752 [Sarcoptes scabiei]|uniref:Uncharacterized protein n=1 Tax=Sarcoptes scabiei TaxID=52283 RepID=A0A834R463_SARSC|nr:hypothetical protein SSS_04752 [Sarcoptes scabiei]
MLLIITIIGAISMPMIWGQTQPSGTTLIRNKYAYTADRGLISLINQDCLRNPYQQQIMSSQSMETLIDYIERLEDVLANTTDSLLSTFRNPDDIARLLLHRFHFEDIDFSNFDTTSVAAQKRSEIDTIILGRSTLVKMDYYFPDYIYNDQELCTLLFMFSHIFLNQTEQEIYSRNRRDTYVFGGGQSRTFGYGQSSSSSSFSQYPIREKGVVTFRQDPQEAIAPARVLIGIIAALTKSYKVSVKEIAALMGKQDFPDPIQLNDPFLATSLANIAGTAAFYDSSNNNMNNRQLYDERLVFGVKGQWLDTTCCNYYALTDPISKMNVLRYSSRGSMAQIRGAIDGYIIGKHLKKIDCSRLRLSTILRSYYSLPHSRFGENDLGVSYCNRLEEKPQMNDLTNEINNYGTLYKYVQDQDQFELKTNLFTSIFDRALQTQSDICRNRPSSNMDRNSPCETPSDLLFVIDPKMENMNTTSRLINEIISKINRFSSRSGSISIFVNTNTRTNVQLPSGPNGWPLASLLYNSTNIGSVTCSINQDNFNFPVQPNFGKFFRQLNQTVFNYKAWSPRRTWSNALPSLNVIVIDYDSLRTTSDSRDRQDYEHFRKSLKFDNPDVRYLIISNSKSFEEILDRKDSDLMSFRQQQIGTNFEKRICDNPATLIYHQCHEKPSDGAIFNGFISPGYKQNYAMYPEYFIKSFDIEFRIRAVDGGMKYCFDREFPPRERPENCKELSMGSEDIISLSNPCYRENIYSCRPFYFTFWGKEKTTPCKEIGCQALDQIQLQSITKESLAILARRLDRFYSYRLFPFWWR